MGKKVGPIGLEHVEMNGGPIPFKDFLEVGEWRVS
jgi:hypothetical protein